MRCKGVKGQEKTTDEHLLHVGTGRMSRGNERKEEQEGKRIKRGKGRKEEEEDKEREKENKERR